jgi:hypothetical protein
MDRMKNDMSAVWTEFANDVETQLEGTNQSVDQAFTKALETALLAQKNSRAAESTRNAMRTIARILRHRKDLAVHGIEQAIENFTYELSTLHTDIFSFIRTAFIGNVMERAYHAANMEHGKLNALTFPDIYCSNTLAQAVAATAGAKTSSPTNSATHQSSKIFGGKPKRGSEASRASYRRRWKRSSSSKLSLWRPICRC